MRTQKESKLVVFLLALAQALVVLIFLPAHTYTGVSIMVGFVLLIVFCLELEMSSLTHKEDAT
jgi:hypothetical protein